MATTAKSQQSDAKDETPDPRDARIAELEQQLEEARRPVPVVTVSGVPQVATGAPVRLKVEAPHSELHYAGRVIGPEFTEVPAALAAAFMEAAADAGVTLTQDQES